MSNERFCMGCMQPISEFSDNCYHCGYPAGGQNPEGYLPVRTKLSERYVVGRALERRADAIVYIGYDKTARNTVVIREFFPQGLCERLSLQVVGSPEHEEAFAWCYQQFLKQARTIARLRDVAAMIPVYDVFEENGTAYTVSDHVEATPFRRYLQQLGGHLKWEEARPLFVPLLSSLVSIHAAGLCHLGISPDSLLVDGSNRLRLDGWQLPCVRSENEILPTVLPQNYAAPEQYQDGVIPSQTADVYAVGATMLYALTGEEPPTAIDRVNKVASLLVPADVAEKWPTHIAPTLCDALLLDNEQRIKTVEQFRDRLTVAPVVEALREEAIEEIEAAAPAKEEKSNTGYKTAIIVLATMSAMMAIAIVWLLLGGNPFGEAPVPNEPTTTTAATTNTTVPTKPTAAQYAVENVVGQTLDEVESRQLCGNMSVHIKGMQYHPVIQKGIIVEQDPMPETFADVNSIIEVYVSAGPEEVPLTDVSGWEREAAVAHLEAMGYTVLEVEVTVSPFERGRVHATQPAAGTIMRYGEEVVLQISNVPTTTTTTTTTGTTYRYYNTPTTRYGYMPQTTTAPYDAITTTTNVYDGYNPFA